MLATLAQRASRMVWCWVSLPDALTPHPVPNAAERLSIGRAAFSKGLRKQLRLCCAHSGGHFA